MEGLSIKDLIMILLPSLISWCTIKQTLKSEKMKLQYDYEKLLIEQRLNYYPELFKITQDIGKKNKSALENIRSIENAYKDLKGRRETGGFILLGKQSLEYFNDLKESLKANPGNGEGGYTEAQLKKIWKQRNKLRGSLKDDIGINIDDYTD